MATTPEKQPYSGPAKPSDVALSPAIVQLLATLRAKIRSYVWLEGIALSVAFVALAFWVVFGIDYFAAMQGGLGLPRAVRLGMLAVVGGGTLYLVWRYILRRAFVDFSDRSLAVVLERRFKEFKDSLVTTVELKGSRDANTAFNHDMLDHTYRDAHEHAGHVNVSDVFNTQPLWRAISSAIVLVASIAIFAVVAKDTFWLAINRMPGFTDDVWPRKVLFAVKNFKNGVAKVPRGADFELFVTATLNREKFPPGTPMEFPQRVTVHYHTDEGASARANMKFTQKPPEATEQEYDHKFQGLLSSLTFDVRGGDGLLRNLRLEVVESPKLNEMKLECTYPEYTEKPKQTLAASGSMVLPLGTLVTLQGISNKPLTKAEVSTIEAGQTVAGPAKPVEVKNSTTIEHKFRVDGDVILQFTLHDQDEIYNREPVRLAITARKDDQPQVAVRLKGIGTAVTPKARIPIVGEVVDDYGLAKLWFDYQIEGLPNVEQEFGVSKDKRVIPFPVETVFDLLDFDRKGPAPTKPDEAAGKAGNDVLAQQEPPAIPDGKPQELLKPGQKFTIAVKARDRHNLAGGPNEGTSERFSFEVVTEDRLRMLLELQEVNLRQRFEAIIAEVYDTRDALVRLDRKPTPPPTEGTPPAGGASEPKKAEEPKKTSSTHSEDTDPFVFYQEPTKDGGEATKAPEQGPEKAPPTKAAERPPVDAFVTGEEELDPVAVRALRVQRAQQNSRKNASETSEVAFSFLEMVEQLDNNRIESHELKGRLNNDIALKLKEIAEKSFPELDKRLVKLNQSLADEGLMRTALRPTVEQTNKVLLEMEAVLDKMKQLEDFNELLVQLRKIIDDEEGLIQDTKKVQTQKVKTDLE